MDEPKLTPLAATAQGGATLETMADVTSLAEEPAVARGSGHISELPPVPPERRERTEHSVMEGLPEAKRERIASMRRELAELHQQLIDAQQRVATELQGRADDAERFEALEARLQAQDLKDHEDATRAAELETELAGLRSQLASASTTADDLRRDVTARDAELATRTSERDTEHSTATRLERELEDQRKQHREVTDQLELQFTSLRDAKALVSARDAELSATTSERDALKVNLDQTRRDLEAARDKTRDIANRLVGFGQDLLGGSGGAQTVLEPKPADMPASPRRTQPPPVPQRPATAVIEPRHVATILELTEQPRPATSRLGSALLVLGGVILGCVVTIAIVKASSASEDIAPPPPSALATEPARAAASGPVMRVDDIASPATPTPGAPQDEHAPSAAAPVEIKTDGVILLPQAATGHRVFVDGRVVEVKSSRAVVRCGSHEVRIGSSGAVRKLDVECGGETALPTDSLDH